MKQKKGYRRLYDNFLTDSESFEITKLVKSYEMLWGFRTGLTFMPDKEISYDLVGDDWGLSYLLIPTIEPVLSQKLFKVLQPLFTQLKIEHPLRVKLNLGVATKEPHVSQYHQDLHADYKYTTAIYYLNTCNGYTQFKSDGAPVKSKENRLVVFDGNSEHRAVSQTDTQMRYVINFNYLTYDLPDKPNKAF